MPRIFDNIEDRLLPVLQETLSLYTDEWVRLLLEKFRDEKSCEEVFTILRGIRI